MRARLGAVVGVLLPQCSWGAVGGRARRALLASETIAWQLASNEGYAVLQDRGVCPEHLSENTTLREAHAAIDLCPSPYYRLREIYPRHLVWTEPDEEDDGDGEGENPQEGGGRGGEEGDPSGGADSSGGAAAKKAKPTDPNDSFVGFLMSARGEYFSQEMEALVAALAPAFPDVWFVRAEGSDFTRFTSQYMVRGFPRLLLFKGGRLQGQYRGERHVATVGAWLAAITDQLPRAVVLPPRRPKPPSVRWDDARLWAAGTYVAVNVLLLLLRWRRGSGGGAGAVSAQRERRP